MAEVEVLAIAKLMRDGTNVLEKKYAIAFDAAEGATVAAMLQKLRSKEAFAGLSLEVAGVTVHHKDFDDYVEVESGDRLTQRGKYIVTFIDTSNERVERAVIGNRPEFAERKPTVRSNSASDDDIVFVPAPSEPERKPEISQHRGLSAASTRRSSPPRSAADPPVTISSAAKASSRSGTDSDRTAPSSVDRIDDSQSSDDAECDVTDAKEHVARAANTVAVRGDRSATRTNAQSSSSFKAVGGRGDAKLLNNGTAVREKKYAIALDAAQDATVAALLRKPKDAFAGLSLEVDGVTVLDKDFNDYVEAERGDRLANMGTYIVTFIEARGERVERAVASSPHVVQSCCRGPLLCKQDDYASASTRTIGSLVTYATSSSPIAGHNDDRVSAVAVHTQQTQLTAPAWTMAATVTEQPSRGVAAHADRQPSGTRLVAIKVPKWAGRQLLELVWNIGEKS